MVNPLSLDSFWFTRSKFEVAERLFYEAKYGGNRQTKRNLEHNGPELKSKISIEIDKVRELIKNSLSVSSKTLEYNERYNKLNKEKQQLTKTINDLKNAISKLEVRVNTLEKSDKKVESKPAAAKPAEDDDDVDLFGSDDDDEEAEKARAERQAQADKSKKAAKPGPIAKSSVVLDIKPWDDETDLKELENAVRKVEMDGLLWGASKLVPIAFGVKKLQIVCVVEDEKVSIEELTEKIEAHEDYVQSVDVAAFSKI